MTEEAEKVLSAARDGDIQTLQSFRRSVPFAADSFGATAIHHASRYGKLECIKWMVEKVGMKAKVKAKNGATPLHDACTQGKLLCVKYFIQDCNLNPDCTDNSGHTPLHLAARFGYLDIVKWLVTKAKCNPRLKTMNRMNAAHFAAAGGHLNCLEFIISSGNTILLDERATDGTTPVFITTQNGHYPCLKYLHTVGANCNLRSRDGMHLIHAAAQNGNLDCIGYLVINGIASDTTGDSTGATPAHYAAGEGHVSVLKWLNKRCDLNVKDQLGGTPLHDAAEKGQLACIQYLVEHGNLNTKLKDKSRLTPIDLAEKHGHKRCYEYLREAASKSNQVKAAKLMSYTHTFDKQSVEDNSGSSFLHVLKKKPRQMDRPVSPKSAKGPNIPPLDVQPEVSPRSSPIPCMIEFGKKSEWRKVDDDDLLKEYPHHSQVERSVDDHKDGHRSHLLDTTGVRELSPLNDEFWASKNGSVTPTVTVDAYSHNADGARTFDDRPDEELTEEMLETAKTRTKVLNARLQNPSPSPLETFDARSEETDSKNFQDFSHQIQAARAKRSPHNTLTKSDYHILQPVVIEQEKKPVEITAGQETPMECGDGAKNSFEDKMMTQSPQTSPTPPKTLTDIFNNTNKDPTPVPSPKQSPRTSPVNLPPQQSIQSNSSNSSSLNVFQPNAVKSPSPQTSTHPKSPSPQKAQPSEEPQEKPPSPPLQFQDRPASPPTEQPRKMSAENNSSVYAPTPLVPLSTPSHKAPVPPPQKKEKSGREPNKKPEIDENVQPIDEENYMTTDDETEKKRSATPEVPQENKADNVPLRQRQLQPLPHMNGMAATKPSPGLPVDQETWATLPEWKRQVLRNRIMKEQQAELEQRRQEELERLKFADVPKWKLPIAKRKESDRINLEEKMANVPEWKRQLIMKKKLKRKAVSAWLDTSNDN